MKDQPFSKLRNSANALTKFKNLPLKNHGANFNQTWHEASLGEETQGFTNKDNTILKKEINEFFPPLNNVTI